MKSRMGLEESAEEAELNLKPGELLRGVKDLQDVARDEVKLGIFSCEEGFLNLNGDRFLGLEEDDEEKYAIRGAPCMHLMALQPHYLELKASEYIPQISSALGQVELSWTVATYEKLVVGGSGVCDRRG